MPLTIPYRFTPGTKADANQVNADLDAVVAKFQGGIVDGDLSTAAAIDGNKLSQASGKQIPTAAYTDDSVTDAKLADDTGSPGNDLNRAVSGNHVKAWTTAHVARILPSASIIGPQLKTTLYTNAGSIVIAAGAVATHVTTVSTTNTVPLAMYLLRVPSTTLPFLLTLYADAGVWKINVYNVGSSGQTVNAAELKLLYVAAS